jgi:hypothetical protein
MALAEAKLSVTETEFFSLINFLAYGCTSKRVFTLQTKDRKLTARPIFNGIELVLCVGKTKILTHLTRKQVSNIVLFCGHYGRVFS